MSRMRALAGVLVLAAGGLLITPAPARAATPLKAAITCDPATGTITTSASGNLLAPGAATPVVVEFQRSTGTRVTATTSTVLAPLPQPFTTRVTSTSSGDVTATGYTGSFDPATSLFYREKIGVTFKNAATGAVYNTREASCDYDQRTTLTLTCDPAARTVTAAVTGVNGQAGTTLGAGRAARIGYRFAQIRQNVKGDPIFRSELFGPGWEFERRLTQAADGSWTDPGYVHGPITGNPFYYAEEVTVGVLDSFGTVVGWRTAKCTLIGDAPA